MHTLAYNVHKLSSFFVSPFLNDDLKVCALEYLINIQDLIQKHRVTFGSSTHIFKDIGPDFGQIQI